MLKLNEILEILKKDNVPDLTVKKIAAEYKAKEELKKDNKSTDPKSKKEYVLLVNPDVKDVGHAVQVEDGDDVSKTVDKIRETMLVFNRSRKGSKNPVKTIAEALNAIPSRFFVENNIWVKTKEVVQVLNYKN